MAKPIPTYLNKEFFKEVLDPLADKNIIITELNIEVNETGGNYCSNIYRATVKYLQKSKSNEEKKTKKLLVKELFEHMNASSHEFFTYTKILPNLNMILIEAGVQKRPSISPNLYLARKLSGEVHVFDDMNALGYTICDRMIGFNAEQSKKVLEKLAYFHAASMIFIQKHPNVVSELKSFFWEDHPEFSSFIKHVIDGNTEFLVDIVSKWEDYKEIAQKMLRNMGEEFERKFHSIFDSNATKLRSIVHGDLWIKNILMLQETDTKVNDAVFIDFQATFVGSPGIDINNFLMTSVQLDVLRSQRDCLIEYYYSSLIETLKKFNGASFSVELPTLDDLHAEILKTEYFTYYDLIFAFPQTNLSEDLAKDMDYGGLFEPERLAKNRKDMFSNPRVLDTVKFVLKRLDRLGVLD